MAFFADEFGGLKLQKHKRFLTVNLCGLINNEKVNLIKD